MITTTTFVHVHDEDAVAVDPQPTRSDGAPRTSIDLGGAQARVTVFLDVAKAQELARAILAAHPIEGGPDHEGTPLEGAQDDVCTSLGMGPRVVATSIGEVLEALDNADYAIQLRPVPPLEDDDDEDPPSGVLGASAAVDAWLKRVGGGKPEPTTSIDSRLKAQWWE